MEVITSKLRINKALKEKGIKRSDLARELEIDRSSVSEMLNSPGEAPVKYMEAAAKLTGLPVDYFKAGSPVRYTYNTEKQEFEMLDNDEAYLKGRHIRPITVVVDRAGKELITYVPVKAQAGYRRGYADPSFIEKLPAFSLPVMLNINATNRMFQVDGNSMRQLGGGGLNDGDIVFGEYVEDIFSLKDGRVYIIVTTEEVLVKRVINRLLTDSKVLILNSDNKGGDYPAIIVHPTEILEVWEYKAHLSRQLPMNTDLFDTINDLQVKHSLLEDRLKSLEMQQLK